MAERPSLVLAGGGHAHALVLLRWIRQGRPDADITLVCNTALAPYSGMLPGEVAGVYRPRQTRIDLQRLCRAAQVRCLVDEAAGIDRAARRLQLRSGASLRYDLLSLNLGATPRMDADGAARHAVPVKPIASFRGRWDGLRAQLLARDEPADLAVVGAGAAGVELAFAMQARLSRERQSAGLRAPLRLTLLGAEPSVLPGAPAGVQRYVTHALQARGIRFVPDARVIAVDAGQVRTDKGAAFAADHVVWVTQAGAAGWLRGTGLALDGHGFVRIGRTLRSVGDAAVFAAGDVASLDGCPLQKSGVVAVRQAPVLADNLRRALAGQPLREWTPQRHWLVILSTADGSAVATRGRWHAHGRWAWHWKQWIDARFMRQFEEASG